MDTGLIPLSKLTGSIYRSTQAYMNEKLDKYHLGCGTYPYLLTLYKLEGINQNQISKELDVDKAMSARAIKKLIDLGYIRKEADSKDARANRLFLTDKARQIIPDIKEELNTWNEKISKSLNQKEKEELTDLLSIVLQDTKNLRNNR